MRKQNIMLILLLILFLTTCVPTYQRYIEGVYNGSSSAELFSILDELVKGNNFVFKGTFEKPQRYTIVADYSRFEDSIEKDVYLMVFLKDIDESKSQTEFLITLNGPGREKPIKRAVDKAFEDLVVKIKARFEESRFKIIKMS